VQLIIFLRIISIAEVGLLNLCIILIIYLKIIISVAFFIVKFMSVMYVFIGGFACTNSTGVFGVRNNKSVKNGRVYHGSSNNNNSQSDINSGSASQLDLDTYIIDDVDQKLLELLIRGYENKKIATEVKTPLSTIQRRIRKIYENQYVSRKNELNYNKLGLRRGYLQISLRGDKSYEVAQKLAGIRGVIAVSELTGNFDILCTCIFKNTDELFNLIEDIKTIERIDKVTWAEEVHSVSIEVGEKIATLGSVPE
jgi:DNA-binding Lrp family transcriptional regulator